jgi:hypothetical protein
METARDDFAIREALKIGARGERDAGQILQGSNVIREQTRLIEKLAVIRDAPVGMLDQRAEPPSLERFYLPAIPSVSHEKSRETSQRSSDV